ncbi:MAG: high-affinity zinc ABC transporter substrate-binding protein [Candidatus Mesenet longicola]|uniref:High-affinity zinc uptake system protein ZnuA n=1 Tax=Candidatus Mesenet longicola TaxID=1892558 RepID=A0A8J3HSK4_9RICK|nr:MAG: high-affinity zinc ABC transporter substrate-binding protein [Candidatus Mesenet longicola]GHM59483.1 MAG: high-affinity zinc ABC transporter substrate-binding protein [Candidatus Mesenet longicola]
MKHVFLFLLLVLIQSNANSHPPKIIATIKPIHSLVASVTYGVLEPELLIDDVVSIHDYMLKPSNANKLEHSDVIFYVSDQLETFIKNIRRKTLVALSQKVDLLPLRSTCRHTKNVKDFHVWLSPENAKIMVNHISLVLGELDKANSWIYRKNAEETIERIERNAQEIKRELSSLKDQLYIVVHDAYQYFEKYFNLSAPSGILPLGDEASIKISTINKIKRITKENNIKCIFSEPQEQYVRSSTFTNGIEIKILDPIGNNITPGKEAYFAIMSSIAKGFKACFN